MNTMEKAGMGKIFVQENIILQKVFDLKQNSRLNNSKVESPVKAQTYNLTKPSLFVQAGRIMGLN